VSEQTDWTECASHCCGCGAKFTSEVATAIWNRMRWCKSCSRGLHPDGFANNGIEAKALNEKARGIVYTLVREYIYDDCDEAQSDASELSEKILAALGITRGEGNNG